MLSKLVRVSLPRIAPPSAGLNWPKLCSLTKPMRNDSLRTRAPAIATSANRALSRYRNPAVAASVNRCESVSREEISAFDHDAPLVDSWGDDTALSSSSISRDGQLVLVKWFDDEEQVYPAVWLRDQCHCSECCFHDSFTRKTFLTDMTLETKIQDAFVSEDGLILSVKWADGHHGNFPTEWLRVHRFDQSQSDPIADLRPRLWGHDVMATPDFSFFDFDDVMESDDALYDWLKVLYGLGMAVLKNAPVEPGQHFRLQKRLGYECPTPISSGIVNQVRLNQKSDHPAYSEKNLQLHNDLTYYAQAKGYQSFHCIQQATGGGGDSLFVDGFKVAEELRRQNPEAFEMLTRIPWEYKHLMGTNYHCTRREAIRLNDKGEVCQVTISDICRTAMLRIPPEDVHNAYVALQEFTRMLYHPEYMAQYMLEPGDILVFNNFRVLHGRLGFSVTAETQRHLETCYSDWEIVSATIRNLRKKQILAKCTSD